MAGWGIVGCTDLRFIFDLHLSGGEQLGVHALRHPSIDIFPRSPNRQAEGKGSANTEHYEPDNVPEIRIQKVEDQIHQIHDREGKRHVVPAKDVAEDPVAATFDVCPGHYGDGCTEGRRQEEIRFRVLAAEHQDPKKDRREAGGTRQRRVGCGKRLGGHVLP